MDLMEHWRRLLLDSSHQETLVGNPIEFTSLALQQLKNCSVSFMFTQSGYDIPSYSSPRPINGFDELNVVAGDIHHRYRLGDTYYGGAYDIDNGLMTITHPSITFDGSYPIDDFYRQDAGVIKITVPYPFAAYSGGSKIPEIWSTNARTISQSVTWDPSTNRDFVAIESNPNGTSTTLYIGRTEWKNKTLEQISALAEKKPTKIVYKTSAPFVKRLVTDTITVASGPCRIECTPSTSFSAKVWVQSQSKYGSVPVLIDNARFACRNGTIEDIIEDPDWFIAGWFDTADISQKPYEYYRVEGIVDAAWRAFNDKEGTSVAMWASGREAVTSYGGDNTASSYGRYIAYSVHKPSLNILYFKGNDLYLFKGKDVS